MNSVIVTVSAKIKRHSWFRTPTDIPQSICHPW